MWNLALRLYSSRSLPLVTSLRCFSSTDPKQLLVYPRLKHLQDTEMPIYASLKQRNPEKALQQFIKLKDEEYKFSSPILTMGLKLMLYYDKPMSWFELSTYLSKVGIYPESALISLMLDISMDNDATETILDILGTCLARGFSIRSNRFTSSIVYLLQKIKDYKIIIHLINLYIEKNYTLQDKILGCLCDTIRSESSNTLLIDLLKKCLRYLHKREMSISDFEVFEKLNETLGAIAGSPGNMAQVIEGACSHCNQNIRKIHLSEEEYATLRTKLHEIIQDQYNKFQRTTGMKVDIENFQSAFSQFYDSVQADDSQGVIIDGMNASFLINSHRCSRLIKCTDVLRDKYPNCKILVVVRRYVLRNTPQDQIDKLREQATVCTTQGDSRDDLFIVYATLRLKERGLLFSNDKFSELRNDIPLTLHSLLTNWYTKHVIHFNLALSCSMRDQLINAIQYNCDGSLHLPLAGTDKWSCTRLD